MEDYEGEIASLAVKRSGREGSYGREIIFLPAAEKFSPFFNALCKDSFRLIDFPRIVHIFTFTRRRNFERINKEREILLSSLSLSFTLFFPSRLIYGIDFISAEILSQAYVARYFSPEIGKVTI